MFLDRRSKKNRAVANSARFDKFAGIQVGRGFTAIHLAFLSLLMGAKILGSGPMANVPFFGVALVSSVIIAIGKCSRSAEFQKIGIGAFFVLLVSGQVLAARVFGYFGLFGIPAPTLTFGKVASAFLVVTRVYLMTFR